MKFRCIKEHKTLSGDIRKEGIYEFINDGFLKQAGGYWKQYYIRLEDYREQKLNEILK